jgi:hypothetical protein
MYVSYMYLYIDPMQLLCMWNKLVVWKFHVTEVTYNVYMYPRSLLKFLTSSLFYVSVLKLRLLQHRRPSLVAGVCETAPSPSRTKWLRDRGRNQGRGEEGEGAAARYSLGSPRWDSPCSQWPLPLLQLPPVIIRYQVVCLAALVLSV